MIIKDSSKSVSKPRINIKEFNKFIEELVGVDNLKEIAENAPTNVNASELDIRNVNVSDDLIRKISDLDIPQFVLDVVRLLEKIDYENIAKLIYTIPIYLKEKGEIAKECYRGEGDIVEPLGAYFKNIRKNESSPCIELYVDKIYESANEDAQTFKWLCTKTLIHELAHAVLDNYNSEIDYRHVDKISYYTPFGKWREESMANAIALKVIKEFGDKDFYDYAKYYMSTQPAEYALGVIMEDFDYGDLRSVMDNKYEGVSQDLQDEWLNYAQGNPDWEGLKQWNKKLIGLE